jgi:hypothetical protein
VAAACSLPPAALLPDPRAPPLPAGWTAHVSRTTGLAYCVAPGGGAVSVLAAESAAWALPRMRDDAPPPPPQQQRWAQKFSATKGRPYFVNLEDGAVRWAAPEGAEVVNAGAGGGGGGGGGAGAGASVWRARVSAATGRPFFVHTGTGEKRWRPPLDAALAGGGSGGSGSSDSGGGGGGANSRGWETSTAESSRSASSEDFRRVEYSSEWLRRASRASGRHFFVNMETRERAWRIPPGGVEVFLS